MRELIIKQNNQLIKRVTLTDKNITIGRDPFCDVILRDKTVSQRHAMILNDLGTSYIEDMGSTNTTQVNFQEIQQHKLQDQDTITIGRFQIHFQINVESEIEKNEYQTTTQTA